MTQAGETDGDTPELAALVAVCTGFEARVLRLLWPGRTVLFEDLDPHGPIGRAGPSLRVVVSRLRRLLAEHDARLHIGGFRGVGYRLMRTGDET